jgi:hypothetical protein
VYLWIEERERGREREKNEIVCLVVILATVTYDIKNVAISDQLFEDDAYEVALKAKKNNLIDMQIDHDIPRYEL